ncbi:putative membrane protein [Arenibacter algicola]|uniref:Membrane protein n=1 Tax=Arenibacter algicola TaxID=616991 RepID=A0ABY3ADC8_9FLAO
MKKKLIISYNRIREHLWFRPFLFCLLSVAGALIAHQADGIGINDIVPNIDKESIGGLLDTIAASMLVISIFAVASMLSAFSSASSTATPRSFKIVVTDDVSQNALSVFIGAFIFSIVATIALDNGYYEKAGRFILFLFTLILFAIVILTFLRWVDRISRLGRLEHTINQVETVASKSLSAYIKNPSLKALTINGIFPNENAVMANSIGYIQHINLEDLQSLAEEFELKIRLNCIPGKFVHSNFAITHFVMDKNKDIDIDNIRKGINNTILVGQTRLFDEDPRFGLISLTEIASRALSPGINDPGTAIQIIGSHERLFFLWNKEIENSNETEVVYNRIEVPEISMEDFFDDAFRPIARDGADNIEVMLRLQKALNSIATINNLDIKENVIRNSRDAYERAQKAINSEHDLNILEKQCIFKNE